MSDATCPYCEEEVEICHDDGFGMDEDEKYDYECEHCEKTFVFTTGISVYHFTEEAPCLNGEPHNYKPTITYPKEFTKMECVYCGQKRDLDETEKQEVMGVL